ncbi:MAG: putative rane protein [Chloroflexota bacterium]|jgi:putative membrane protein|nr:putative rane protein [Chloroflexota bacterium]
MSIELGGMGLVPLVGFLVVIVFWGLIITALVLGIRWLIRADRRGQIPPPPATPDPLEVLRHRYAKGEIDEEEFDRRRKTLTGG